MKLIFHSSPNVGFNNPNDYSSVFSELVGIPPLEYRRLMLNLYADFCEEAPAIPVVYG